MGHGTPDLRDGVHFVYLSSSGFVRIYGSLGVFRWRPDDD